MQDHRRQMAAPAATKSRKFSFLSVALVGTLSSCNAFALNRWGPLAGGGGPRPASSPIRLSGVAGPSENGELRAGGGDDDDDDDAPDGDRNVKTADILSLDSIRSTLIRQEETIIFALIEREQFRHNPIVYERGGFGKLGVPLGSTTPPGDDESDDGDLTFLEYMLVGTETLHCGVRRYTSPEEHPFFPERLPAGPIDALPNLDYPTDLLSNIGGASEENFNRILLKKYVEVIVPSLCKPGDDEQHGSTVISDIAVLQALSRRVHYGKFVAESKYRADPEGYQRLVDAGDADGVMKLLTNEAVEAQVLRRARLKAATYGREPLMASLPNTECSDATSIVAAAAASAVVAAVEAMGDEKQQGKVDPALIEGIYRDIIIPMTKDIEVAYLFRRCGKEPPPEYAPDRMSIDAKKTAACS